MYSRQHRISRKPSDSHDVPASNQFAPRPFVIQPQTEEVKPPQSQTADLQAKGEKSKEIPNGFPDAAVFTRHVAPPKTPRVQMKLNIGKVGDKYEQEADKTAANVVQQNGGMVEPKLIDLNTKLSLDNSIQRTIWYCSEKESKWLEMLQTSNLSNPEFQGKPGDIYDNESGNHTYENAIKEIFTRYRIGNLGDFELKIDYGEEQFHGKTELGFDRNGTYEKPVMTISEKYIRRMIEERSVERIIRTLRHEWEHVSQRKNQHYMAAPNKDQMELEAYYQEIYDDTIPEHTRENKLKKMKTALEHLEKIPLDQRNKSETLKNMHEKLFKDYKELKKSNSI